MNPVHNGNTITNVLGTSQQVKEFAERLIRASDKADQDDEVQHVRGTFEQSISDGPWEILFHIVKE